MGSSTGPRPIPTADRSIRFGTPWIRTASPKADPFTLRLGFCLSTRNTDNANQPPTSVCWASRLWCVLQTLTRKARTSANSCPVMSSFASAMSITPGDPRWRR